MAESTLALNFDEIQARVARYMFGLRSTASLSSDESAELDGVIQDGYRNFLWPTTVDGKPNTHQWSFLKPAYSFQTTASDGDYDLPDNYQAIAGPFNYSSADDKPKLKITLTNEAEILCLRSQDDNLTSYPYKMAVRPKTTDGTNGQRFELLLYPIPDDAYTIQGRIAIMPDKLATGKYPYGGAAHGPTILASCMAVAEIKMHDQAGPHAEEFRRLLAGSISRDQRAHAADFLGYNGDPSGSIPSHWMRDGRRLENFSPMTYGGSEYTG